MRRVCCHLLLFGTGSGPGDWFQTTAACHQPASLPRLPHWKLYYHLPPTTVPISIDSLPLPTIPQRLFCPCLLHLPAPPPISHLPSFAPPSHQKLLQNWLLLPGCNIVCVCPRRRRRHFTEAGCTCHTAGHDFCCNCPYHFHPTLPTLPTPPSFIFQTHLCTK